MCFNISDIIVIIQLKYSIFCPIEVQKCDPAIENKQEKPKKVGCILKFQISEYPSGAPRGRMDKSSERVKLHLLVVFFE